MEISLAGKWDVELSDGTKGTVRLPGTLDESGVGHKDNGANRWHPDAALGNAGEAFEADAPIATRFTRLHTYEGAATFRRTVDWKFPTDRRVFLKAERARALRLLIDGREIPVFRPASLSTPYLFEVTGLPEGSHEIELICDNSYPGMPRDAIVYSSAATDETQTNWNGILGEFGLYTEDGVFVSELAVLPQENKSLLIRAEISADRAFRGFLSIESECMKKPVSAAVEFGGAGVKRLVLTQVELAENCRLWDEEGNLYEVRACVTEDRDESRKIETAAEKAAVKKAVKRVRFGVRTFGDNGAGRLALNGRTVFLRSEANCGEFPETGHAPMTVEEWEDILKRYRSYGVNCVRFHSHCPPEAAFAAADRIGMLMQPELSHWNPKDAFESEESYLYYRRELECVLAMLANHPSFVMLTLGNELHSQETGHERMDELLKLARTLDNTRLYANGSNVHYGERGCDPVSDFYTSQSCHEARIRGTFSGMEGYINRNYPNAKTNYDRDMELIRREYKYQKPVFSFEVGQFEVLPDFGELSLFKGISDPANLRLIQEKVRALGLEQVWERYVEATGELARIGYREEIEAAMRTKQLSGISLLGLQDFPGQGTALVGMMNSHLLPKPYDFAKPERFREFFRDSLPLVLLEQYTYEAGETLRAEVLVANFGRQDVEGELRYELKPVSDGGKEISGSLGRVNCAMGGHTAAGELAISLAPVETAVRYDLKVSVAETENTYPVWVYPKERPVCPEGVWETEAFDEAARERLREGGVVYLSPKSDKEHLPHSIQAQFTTDFWSVGTFSNQEGGMGQLIDAGHPLFRGFPTETHTNWQWWIFATQRAAILPRPMKAIVAEMDSYAYLRPMAQLMEFRCEGGRLLFSTLGLQELQRYPEARALLSCVYRYLASEEFAPEQEIAPEEMAGMVNKID